MSALCQERTLLTIIIDESIAQSILFYVLASSSNWIRHWKLKIF